MDTQFTEEVYDEFGTKIRRVITFQKNGWIRINDYYEDGTTVEYYERGE